MISDKDRWRVSAGSRTVVAPLRPRDLVDVPRLTLTHHRALLPLPDRESKEAWARRALGEGWITERLAEEVRKHLPKPRGGRRPEPAFAKTIHGESLARVEALKAQLEVIHNRLWLPPGLWPRESRRKDPG